MSVDDILYEDAHIIVCVKPRGIATEGGNVRIVDMESKIKNYRASKGEEPYAGVISRLDTNVEGILVFAKTKASAANLSKQVQDRTFQKRYRALISGYMSESEGTLEDYLVKDGKNKIARIVNKQAKGAKLARLDYEAVNDDKMLEDTRRKAGLMDEEASQLVDITLHTGRFHQIRAQFAHKGHPLIGDYKYGYAKGKEGSTKAPLMLCAYGVSFNHPESGGALHFEYEQFKGLQ